MIKSGQADGTGSKRVPKKTPCPCVRGDHLYKRWPFEFPPECPRLGGVAVKSSLSLCLSFALPQFSFFGGI